MESINGATKKLHVEKTEVCSACKGSRCRTGTGPTQCSSCKGQGYTLIRRGIIAMQTTCGNCGGAGRVIQNPCMNCNGNGVQTRNIYETIDIPAGVDNGSTLRLPKKGNSTPNGAPGDLVVRVRVTPHQYFKREGTEIHCDKEISFTQVWS